MADDDGSLQRLNASAVRETVQRLEARIAARFPRRHLRDVAADLAATVLIVSEQSSDSRRRKRLIRIVCRIGVVVIAVLSITAIGLAVRDAFDGAGSVKAFEWLPVIESAINDIVYAAIAIYFLVSIPSRIERRATLGSLHRLRSLAHVIDMHQLTKDPERLRPRFRTTTASIDIDLDEQGLASYLDYCSELLSLVSKTAALCAETSTDGVVLETVSEIEILTNGMSRKIWQKISLLPRG